MYIIGILIIAIGLIPLILGRYIYTVFRGTPLSAPVALFMVLLFLWQIDIAILYMYEILPISVIDFVFRLLRFAILYPIPLIIYISYKTFDQNTIKYNQKSFFDKILSILINRTVFIITLVLSTFIYILNWTPYGLVNFYHQELVYKDNLFILFPKTGDLHIVFFIIESLLITFVIISSLMSIKNIQNKSMRDFMKTFYIFSAILIFSAPINLIPGLGSMFSSICVIFLSLGIMLSFFKMHVEQTKEYHTLIEREKKMDYMGSLSTSLIHEIRNPLNHIKNFSYIIEKTETLSKDGQEYFEYIQEGSKHLETLVDNFTDYIQTNKFDFEMANLDELIKKAIQLTTENAKENNVTVFYKEEFENMSVRVNIVYFTQVLVNLIKNCSEAMPQDRKERWIKIKPCYEEGSIAIFIEDSGKGIPPEEWEKVFNPFISNKSRGMGIGLAFSRKIMYEHRGDLIVNSSSPKGTQFKITLPQYIFDK